MQNFFLVPIKLDFFFNTILIYISLTVIVITCIKIIISKNLLEITIMMSILSVFLGIYYLLLDAPDVAITEIALGACLSTCVLLNLIQIVGVNIGNFASKSKIFYSAVLCSVFVICLSWTSLDLPIFGSHESPLQNNLTKYYIEHTVQDVGIPSIVTAILASYRGFDTLGETSVILIAGLAVIFIQSEKKHKSNA